MSNPFRLICVYDNNIVKLKRADNSVNIKIICNKLRSTWKIKNRCVRLCYQKLWLRLRVTPESILSLLQIVHFCYLLILFKFLVLLTAQENPHRLFKELSKLQICPELWLTHLYFANVLDKLNSWYRIQLIKDLEGQSSHQWGVFNLEFNTLTLGRISIFWLPLFMIFEILK